MTDNQPVWARVWIQGLVSAHLNGIISPQCSNKVQTQISDQVIRTRFYDLIEAEINSIP